MAAKSREHIYMDACMHGAIQEREFSQEGGPEPNFASIAFRQCSIPHPVKSLFLSVTI
jgi:hypothetical protein